MQMKQNRITLLREILVTQMNHWMIFPFYLAGVTMLGDIVGTGEPHVLLWLLMGSIPFLLYRIRTGFSKFGPVLLLHLAVIVLMLFLPMEHISIKVFQTFIAVVYIIYSGYLWFATEDRKDSKLHPFLGVGLSVLMLVVMHHQGHTEWDSALVMILIITLGLYFISYYIERYQNFLMVNNSSAGHIPAREMFHSGMGLVTGYTGICLLFLLLISNIQWMRGVLNALKNGFGYLLIFLFSIIPTNTQTYVESTEETVVQDNADNFFAMEPTETFWLWNVVDSIVTYLFIAAMIFVVIKVVMFLVKLIRTKLTDFHLPAKNKKIPVDENVVDVREKCDIVRDKDWKARIPFLNLNPRERIRQLYKKRILSSKHMLSTEGIDSERLNRYTARECSNILKQEELAILYEKARYSNAQCDGDDVKQMRNACK